MKSITVIHCWSAPRSRSTALLYSFQARGADVCVAMDEPLYREWLIQRGDTVARPYRQQLIQGIPPDDSDQVTQEEKMKWARELKSLQDRIMEVSTTLPDDGSGVIFCKHMAKHYTLYNFYNPIQSDQVHFVHKHLLLIRDPVAVLSSWDSSGDVHGSNPTSEEVGIVPLLSIYSMVTSQTISSTSPSVVIIDSDALVQNPTLVLQDACHDLGISYSDKMLSWHDGPHECDGPWAQWWYTNVHKSTGWTRDIPMEADYSNINTENDVSGSSSTTTTTTSIKTYSTLHPNLIPALRTSFPAFEFLMRLTRQYQGRGPPSSVLYSDPRNEHLLVWIGVPGGHGRLIPRDMAGISPWDSSVQGGDATWEGIRVYRGKILHLDKHLQRLRRSAKALGFTNMHSKEEIVQAIFRTLAANGMRDGAHMRLTLTRGEKYTSSMNPKFNVYGTTLIILAEWKPVEDATTYNNTTGIKLISASQRRNSPQTVDSKIHHNNMINNILPKIQANFAGCADAIMLDVEGYVSETNATNLFMVDDTGMLLTPHADHCLPGITRATVLELAHELHIPVTERRISLAEFHAAEEVFTTGTMGELTPVVEIDGRVIGSGKRGPLTERLQELYRTVPDRPGYATVIPPFSM